MPSGARICAEVLHEAGIARIFGIPGQRILPFVNELQNGFGIPVVLTRHEQGAAFMADAYGRVAGIGCCFATSGPGATNLLTGAAASYMDSVAMLAITAQAETTEFGRYGIQEGTGLGRTPDVSAMFEATCKATLRPMTVAELRPALVEALTIARTGRPGPVHVDIPSDLFLLEGDAAEPAAAQLNGAPKRVGPPPSPGDIAEVRRLVEQAERPLVLAGNGVLLSGCLPELMRFAEEADVAVAGTFLAKSALDERHPLVLGPVGVYGRPEANEALHHEADLVLALGVSLNYMTTTGWSARLDAPRLVRVDLDPRELTNNYDAGVTVEADVGAFVAALVADGPLGSGDGRRRVASLRERAADEGVDEPDPAAPALHPVTVCRALSDRLTPDTVVVADVGQNAYWVERHLRTHGERRFMINGGLGSMGHGVVGAIGVAAAREDLGDPAHVVAVCGDGGFMMGALELSVAAAAGANVTWVIFNNETLGTQRAWFTREGHAPAACDLPPVDYVALARSMGLDGERVEGPTELDAALDRAFATDGPRVVEVRVDPAPSPAPFVP